MVLLKDVQSIKKSTSLLQKSSSSSYLLCARRFRGIKKPWPNQVRCQQTSAVPCMAAVASCSEQHSNSSAPQQQQQSSTQAGVRGIGHAILGIMAAICNFLQQATPAEFQGSRSPVHGALRTLRMATVVVPFASAGMGGTAFLVTRAVASFLQTYLLLLFLRVLLSWFPTFNWERQPWLTLRQMTDPYLQLFRGLIPPLLGMIDFTPLLGFFVLQWISGELQSITMEGDIEEFW